ncbi:HCP-like protein [Neocallimastix lanati (nom. inval.)]|jgi:TPR repeat protein|uniref:HCP-like protein n=1 Tax=Neocallimastix californiae TaxID=1754190 RepID=A0A1Y2DNW7_9FUNG|nr:HCP-like protein [Neocallimastix sp. JGI-2020a]ORY60355.1 HCP-like protein [Neocallimastix californiae]|eukprot:ORY60355.1 HCP-like protein [Neocallimastix californiae]
MIIKKRMFGDIIESSSSIYTNTTNSTSSNSNIYKEELTPERKLVYLVKSIAKYQAAHNSEKLLNIAKSMYNDSKQEHFSPVMKKTYKKQALSLLKSLSKQEYSDAEYYLGIIYQEKEKFKKAAKFFDLSYQHKQPMGTFKLGQCYENGNGKPKNIQYAEILYRKAAMVGYCLPAMIHLGMSYLEGTLGNKNVNEAIHWLKKVATTNSENANQDLIAKACYELYKIYALGGPNGDGSVPQDLEEALLYLKMSAEHGSTKAIMEICNLESQNPEKLLYWTKRAAELDCLEAQIKLATWYLCENSDIVSKDEALGFNWLKQAALPKDLSTDSEKRNQGCIQFILGTYYETGIENVQLPDENEALYWFGISAKLGIMEAIEKIKEKKIEHNYEDLSISDFINLVMDKGIYGKPSESSLECQQILKDLPNKRPHSVLM